MPRVSARKTNCAAIMPFDSAAPPNARSAPQRHRLPSFAAHFRMSWMTYSKPLMWNLPSPQELRTNVKNLPAAACLAATIHPGGSLKRCRLSTGPPFPGLTIQQKTHEKDRQEPASFTLCVRGRILGTPPLCGRTDSQITDCLCQSQTTLRTTYAREISHRSHRSPQEPISRPRRSDTRYPYFGPKTTPTHAQDHRRSLEYRPCFDRSRLASCLACANVLYERRVNQT